MIFETLDTRNILDRYRREWCSSSRSTNPEMFNDAILHDDILVEQTGWPPDHAGDSERWRDQGGDLQAGNSHDFDSSTLPATFSYDATKVDSDGYRDSAG